MHPAPSAPTLTLGLGGPQPAGGSGGSRAFSSIFNKDESPFVNAAPPLKGWAAPVPRHGPAQRPGVPQRSAGHPAAGQPAPGPAGLSPPPSQSLAAPVPSRGAPSLLSADGPTTHLCTARHGGSRGIPPRPAQASRLPAPLRTAARLFRRCHDPASAARRTSATAILSVAARSGSKGAASARRHLESGDAMLGVVVIFSERKVTGHLRN